MKRHLAALAVVPLALISSALLLFGGIPKTLAADAALRIGPGGRVTFPHHPIMHTGTRVTVEFWVKTEPSSGGIDWLRNAGPQEHKQVVAYADGSINYLYTGSPWHQYPQYGGVTLPGPGTIPIDSQWHHLAFVRRDNGTWSFYVDGTRIVNEGPGTGLGNGCWLTCDIREGSPATELRCLSDALSSFAIDSLRVSKVARYDQDFVPARSWVSDTETAMLLNFDEGSGYTVQDQGPGQQIGTISSGTWVKGLSVTNAAPTVIIKSATMRGATGLMDVVFRVNDPDDATVKTRALAFIDGQRSFAKVIKPTTFAEGTESKLGDAIASNTDHTLTWNVAADWNISLGQIKFEILAMDTRGLLPLDWVTIPAANGQPELTISKNAPTDQQTLDALFWQYASGDPGLILKDGILRATPASGVLDGALLANGPYAQFYGPVYALKIMDLAAADERHTDQCAAARVPITDPLRWHALRKPFELFQPGVVWGWSGGSEFRPDSIIAGLAGVKQVSDVYAITRNGMVVTWQKSSAVVPADLRNVVDIAFGGDFGLALKSDGSCISWAPNNYFTDPNGLLNIPASASEIIDIDCSPGLCTALKRDGTLVTWGDPNQPLSIYNLSYISGLTQISARTIFGLGLRADGSTATWGWGLQLFPDRKFKSISAGEGFYLGLQDDDSVFFWGFFLNGPPLVSPPASLNNIEAISAGNSHALALRKDGTVVAWGSNLYGECDVPAGLSNVKYIYGGNGFSIALKKAP